MVVSEVSLNILQAVGLYRIATRATIGTLIPGEPDKRLGSLVRDGFLRTIKGFPSNRTLYQLTKKGAATAGVSVARSRRMGGQSLQKNLGVLLFCHIPGVERHRIEATHLSAVLGDKLQDRAFCLCRVKDRTIAFDCYVPGPHTPVPTVHRRIGILLKATRSSPALSEAVRDQRFGFAVITHTAQRRKAIMDAVRTKRSDEPMPLIKRVRIWVEAVDELGVFSGTAQPDLGHVSRGAQQTRLHEAG